MAHKAEQAMVEEILQIIEGDRSRKNRDAMVTIYTHGFDEGYAAGAKAERADIRRNYVNLLYSMGLNGDVFDD